MTKKLIFGILLLNLMSNFGYSQQHNTTSKPAEIFLDNPSFEDYPHVGIRNSSVEGWYDCGRNFFPSESPPDIHPSPDPGQPYFNVRTTPYDGKTFLGMVARENNTWESVSQRLSEPLKPGKCYNFSIYLCRSDTYTSAVSNNRFDLVPFTRRIQLRIWGGNTYCGKLELLDASPLVNNTAWTRFEFQFKPKAQVSYIMLEAFYETPILFPYNGNILVDKASSIVEFNCNEPIAAAVKKPSPKAPAKPAQPKPATPVVAQTQPKQAESNLSSINSKDLKEGQTIRIDKLYFAADSANFSKESLPALNYLAGFMEDNPKLIVEIGGHTNGIPDDEFCDRLSTARAKSIYDFLINVGVQPARLRYKGYGKRLPLATNKTVDGRKKNQRVEIKILSLNG